MSQAPWPVVTLGDHIDLLTGFPFKSAQFSDADGALRLLRGANIQQGFIDWRPLKRWPNSEAAPYGRYRLAVGDVVLAMDRPWVDAGLKWAKVSNEDVPSLLVQRVSRIRGKHGLLTDFLPYVVGSKSFQDYIAPIVTGVNVPHISPSQIKAFSFQLPPISTQRRIASILSAYDDLIENNTRRIQILEEMAQAIYREWFVEFRFPGHEGVRMVESELGPLPAKWEARSLADVTLLVSRGVSPKYDVGADARVVNQKCIRGGWLSMEPSRPHSTAVPPKKELRVGDVLVNSTGTGTLGRVAQVLSPLSKTTVDSHVTIVRPDPAKILSDYIGLNLVGRDDEFASMAAGSTGQTELSRGRISDMTLAVPDVPTQQRFSSLVSPIRALSVALRSEITNLRATRDLLLPRLISGEIDVSTLDIGDAEPAA